jgi:large subunit ribosomal protein L6
MVAMAVREVAIPEGVNVEISGNKIKVSGPKGEIVKELKLTKDIKVEKVENKVVVSSSSDRRKANALVGTIAAHVKNYIHGVQQGYTYKLKVCFSHFPITVKVDGDKVVIQNFLGERKPRVAKILGKSQVKVEGPIVTVSGIDLDEVSQTAGNIERATRIVGYDKRKFQDGIYIISKGE